MENQLPPVAPVFQTPPPPPASRKKTLVILLVVMVLGAMAYFVFSDGGGAKGSFVDGGEAPLSGEAAPVVTGEAKPADTPPAEAEGDSKAEDTSKDDASAEKPADEPAAETKPVSIKTITSTVPAVKPGGVTTIVFKGSNLSSMTLTSSNTAFTFTGTAIMLTIPAGAAATFDDLVILEDGNTATAKVTVADTAIPGKYGISYFDTAVGDKTLGTIQNVLTIE